MKPLQIKTYNTNPPKKLPKVDHHEMKARVKALTGKRARLYWGKNGNPHNAVGIIKKLYRVQFDFEINSEMLLKIRFDNVTDVKQIKIK